MKRSEFIRQLMSIPDVQGDPDPEILVQSQGCCSHGHLIIGVTIGNTSGELQYQEKIGDTVHSDTYKYHAHSDEAGCLVVRV